MRKTLIVMLVLSLCISMLSGCKKQTLSIPEYPLDATTIAKVLEERSLSFTFEEFYETSKERTLYTLLGIENGKFAFAVLSGIKDGERVLHVTFPQFTFPYNTVTLEECENFIVFATILFGSFDSSNQVYDAFEKEYDSINTEKTVFEKGKYYIETRRDATSRWKSNINGIDCLISLEQPRLGETQEYLRDILFTSNWDTFFPE